MISMKFRSLSLQLCEKLTFSEIGLLKTSKSFKAYNKPHIKILLAIDYCFATKILAIDLTSGDFPPTVLPTQKFKSRFPIRKF